MKVVVAGGSGFLGTALRAALLADGHAVANLTRRPIPTAPDDVMWTPDGSADGWAHVVDGADAVVNLAGAGIADTRWTDERKDIILKSRIAATRSLVTAIARAAAPPRVLVSASAVGYYGPRDADIVTEAMPAGTDFLAKVCVEWEREADQASAVTRVAIVRTGVALHPEGGALARMLLPFKFGVGGPLGGGTQYMPWIHRDDWIDLVRWLIAEPAARGAFNATSSAPVTNAEFVRALGRALWRPAVLPVPGFGLRLLFGEMADLLLTGQRAIPTRALEMGFRFRFEKLDEALADLLSVSARTSQ
jgi:uncharacterized protein (TIGR01777 family)